MDPIKYGFLREFDVPFVLLQGIWTIFDFFCVSEGEVMCKHVWNIDYLILVVFVDVQFHFTGNTLLNIYFFVYDIWDNVIGMVWTWVFQFGWLWNSLTIEHHDDVQMIFFGHGAADGSWWQYF